MALDVFVVVHFRVIIFDRDRSGVPASLFADGLLYALCKEEDRE